MPWHAIMPFLNHQPIPIGVTADLIASCKENNSAQKLSHGLPDLFAHFLGHARALAFDEEPDYDGFIDKFRQLATQL